MTKSDQLDTADFTSAALTITEYVTLEDEKRKVTYLNPFSAEHVASIADHLSACVLIGRALSQMAKTSGRTIDQSFLDSLCMWHDAPESRYGDIGRDKRKYLIINENKARNDMFGALPWGEEIINIIERFEAGGENQEVKLARDADALYVLITIKEFLQKGIRINNPDQRIERTLKRLSTDEAFQLGKLLAGSSPDNLWEVLFEKANYKGPKTAPFPTRISTTMCIGWMLSELAKLEGETNTARDNILHEIFLQKVGANEFAHDAYILYDQLQQKRMGWQKQSEEETDMKVSQMLLTPAGKQLAEALAKIDLFDWWQIAQGYAELAETGTIRLFNT